MFFLEASQRCLQFQFSSVQLLSRIRLFATPLNSKLLMVADKALYHLSWAYISHLLFRFHSMFQAFWPSLSFFSGVLSGWTQPVSIA